MKLWKAAVQPLVVVTTSDHPGLGPRLVPKGDGAPLHTDWKWSDERWQAWDFLRLGRALWNCNIHRECLLHDVLDEGWMGRKHASYTKFARA